MDGLIYESGIALILEGDTEKVFYLSLIEYLCKKHGLSWNKRTTKDKTEVFYEIVADDNRKQIVKFHTAGAITQIVRADKWFKFNCRKQYPKISWYVFLCYDTDSYSSEISRFYEGDWKRLRDALKDSKTTIIDLAASADIEDLMLLDKDGIFRFMNQPVTEIPEGSKGKKKMKRLFKSFGHGCAYHEGNRAEGLIKSLDFEKIMNASPVMLRELERVLLK